jgi:hypothetical protein
LVAAVASACDPAPDRLERLLEPRRHELRAHVGGTERQGRLALERKSTLQFAVSPQDGGERGGEIGSGEAISERRAAVRQKDPARARSTAIGVSMRSGAARSSSW